MCDDRTTAISRLRVSRAARACASGCTAKVSEDHRLGAESPRCGCSWRAVTATFALRSLDPVLTVPRRSTPPRAVMRRPHKRAGNCRGKATKSYQTTEVLPCFLCAFCPSWRTSPRSRTTYQPWILVGGRFSTLPLWSRAELGRRNCARSGSCERAASKAGCEEGAICSASPVRHQIASGPLILEIVLRAFPHSRGKRLACNPASRFRVRFM